MALWQFYTLVGVLIAGFAFVGLQLKSIADTLLDFAIGLRRDISEGQAEMEKALRPMEDIGVWAADQASTIRMIRQKRYG